MKNIGIGTRILLLISVIIILLVISLSLISSSYLSKSYKSEVQEIVKTRKLKFDEEIDNITQYALYSATICGQMPFVKESYGLYYSTLDFDQSSLNLKKNIDILSKTLKTNSKLNIKIHYHLPPNKSFARSWSDERGDNTSQFRKSIVHVNKYQTGLAGIELGRPGLLLRGISPIFDENLRYLGAVDVSFPFLDIFEKFVMPENESIAVYLEIREYSEYNRDTLLHRVGSFMFNDASSNLFNTELVTRELFADAAENGEIFEKRNNIYQYAYPLYDFNNEVVAYVVHQVDNSKHSALMYRIVFFIIAMGFLFLFIAIAFLYIFMRDSVSIPLLMVKNKIEDIRLGRKFEELEFNRTDEIFEIANEINDMALYKQRINELIDAIRLKDLNNINVDYFNTNDALADSIMKMYKSVLENQEFEQQRIIDDKIRTWTAEGFANFNKIIREHSDLNRLADAVLKELIEILGANQGGLFILSDKNNSKPKFELLASYAYDRRRYHQKEIYIGEGLIGMAAIEKTPIYLTDIPEAYVELTSGLGSTMPRCLLIIPLLQDDNILGIIELAALVEFEEYKIKFAEEVAKSIASSISITRINRQTQELLEETKFQAEQMAAQEEEMRQNMEELKATQEEMSKKESYQSREIENLNIQFSKKITELKQKELEMEGVFNALNTSTFLIEYDLEGNIIFVNDFVTKLFGKLRHEIIGKPQSSFVQYSDIQIQESRVMWEKLRKGEVIKTVQRFIINNAETWLAETYTPILDERGIPMKVLKIAHNITTEKIKERELKDAMEQVAKVRESQSRTIDKLVQRSERKEQKLKQEIQRLKENK